MGTDDDAELFDHLAPLLGIETTYRDVMGTNRRASVDTVLAVAGAMGHELTSPKEAAALARHLDAARAAEPVGPLLLSWAGEHLVFDLRLSAVVPTGRVRAHVRCEDGMDVPIGVAELGAFPVRLDRVDGRDTYVSRVDLGRHDLPPGYHTIVLDLPGLEPVERPLIHAPRRMVELRPDERLWGVFAPIYALRGRDEETTVTDLDRLAAMIDRHGARLLGTLPVLASYLGEPFEPSPYSPVSRQAWNEVYLDYGAIPELAGRAGQELIGRPPMASTTDDRTFDYRSANARARHAFDELLGDRRYGRWPAALTETYDRWVEQHPDARGYAAFRARVDAVGTDWRDWPAGTVATTTDGTYGYHLFGQFEMGRQLSTLFESLERRAQRLYLDLPVGSHAGGFDTWKHRDLFAHGTTCGAAPDEFYPDGQSWGFPPMIPAASSATGHAFFRSMVAHHMGVAGVLRLDHVMGLHRLYWVPEGMTPAEGTFVRYPREELMAVLAVESHRHDCVVVGENLGTVPDEVTTSMEEHGLLGMYVAEFNTPVWSGGTPDLPSPATLASVDTHDTPTFAGWRAGADFVRRRDLGQLDAPACDQLLDERRNQVTNLVALLDVVNALDVGDRTAAEATDVEMHDATVRLLADSDAAALLITLEDLWGETEPQNVPSTGPERANWVQRFPYTLDELATDADLADALDAVQAARLGSHLRARPGG